MHFTRKPRLFRREINLLFASVFGGFHMQPRGKKGLSIEGLAKEWGVDPQTIRIKAELVDVIRKYCATKKISQRRLATMVPGLSQDRVWKIFSGQVGHMTIDKLIAILSTIGYKVDIRARAA